MKFNLFWDRPSDRAVMYDYTLGKQESELDAAQLADIAAYKRGLGIGETAVASAPTSHRLRREAAEIEELKRNHWEVLFSQGVPVREAEALRWWARRLFFERLKANPRFPGSVAMGVGTTLTEASGGVLPPMALCILDELSQLSRSIVEARDKRTGLKPSPKMKRPIPDRFDAIVLQSAKESIRKADFRYRVRKHALTLEVAIFNRNSAISPEPPFRIYEKRDGSRRNGKKSFLYCAVTREWHRTVFRAGLANIFGPRTFVLRADVTASGTRVLVAMQGKGSFEVKVCDGYLSRGPKQEPIFLPANKR